MVRRKIESYGDQPRQFGEWFIPDVERPPLVILVHGGYFRPVWKLDLEEPSAIDLAEHGFGVWSIEYRTYESGWPTTLLDVAAAIDYGLSQAERHGIDASRRALYGHSAGGALALWTVSRRSIPEGAPGRDSQAPTFDLAVMHAPVACLTQASYEHLGSGAVDIFMGGRVEDVPERYAVCDPAQLVPTPGGRLVLLHGDADDAVPISYSEACLAHALAHGVNAELIHLPGQGHYEILDPASQVSGLRRELLAEALLT